jgi:hypothetical protein
MDSAESLIADIATATSTDIIERAREYPVGDDISKLIWTKEIKHERVKVVFRTNSDNPNFASNLAITYERFDMPEKQQEVVCVANGKDNTSLQFLIDDKVQHLDEYLLLKTDTSTYCLYDNSMLIQTFKNVQLCVFTNDGNYIIYTQEKSDKVEVRCYDIQTLNDYKLIQLHSCVGVDFHGDILCVSESQHIDCDWYLVVYLFTVDDSGKYINAHSPIALYRAKLNSAAKILYDQMGRIHLTYDNTIYRVCDGWESSRKSEDRIIATFKDMYVICDGINKQIRMYKFIAILPDIKTPCITTSDSKIHRTLSDSDLREMDEQNKLLLSSDDS